MDAYLPSLLDGASVVAVVLLVGWMVWTGRLVTQREAEGLRKERDDWQAAYRVVELERRTQAKQVDQLLEHARASDALLHGITELAQRGAT